MKRFVLWRPVYLLAGLIAAILMYACFLSGTSALAAPALPPSGKPGMLYKTDISDKFKDENFRKEVWKWLGKTGTPGAFTQQDIIERLPEKHYSLNVSESGIKDLSGLEYFDGLKTFYCHSNQLKKLPPLPAGLEDLWCYGNQLEELPPLPAGLRDLWCYGNKLEALPPLPESLVYLQCYRNKITSLGELPAGLYLLRCDYNELTALPDLPAGLYELSCSGNRLSALPDLPDSLENLTCNENRLTSLPDLPENIRSVKIKANRFTSLPSFPDGLWHLDCSDNQLTELPRLPSEMTILICSGNNLRRLPALPGRIVVLNCRNNKLSSLPTLPNSLREIECGNNKLSSLPTLPNSLREIECAYNALTELPDISELVSKLDISYNFIDFATLDELMSIPRDNYVYGPQLRLHYAGSGIELGKGETERLENVLKIQAGTLSSGRITWSDLRSADIADLTFDSSNTEVARVDSSGVITGVKEGTCTVYALMHGPDTEYTKTAVTVNVSGGTPRPGDSGIDYSSASEWAVEELETAASYGLVTDKVKSSLRKDITREEFCSIAVKLYEALSGSAAAPAVYNPFADTADTDVLKAYEAGIVKGISADKFAPDNKITRQEICVMIYRAIKAAKPGLDYSTTGVAAFADEDRIASWAIQEVRFAFKNNIMKGTGGNKISPLSNTTREQGIVLVKRTYEAFRDR